MRVKCKIDKLSNLNDTMLHKRVKEQYNTDNDYDLFIKKEKEYVVYGIVWLGDEITKFLLCDEENYDYPTPFISVFFDIVDNSIPSDWKIKVTNDNEKIYTLISFA